MTRILSKSLISSAVVLVLYHSSCAPPVIAAETFPEPTPNVKTHELTFSPAKEASPAFRYQLLTPLSETNPGNAAIYYERALLTLGEYPKKTPEQAEREAILFEMPIDKFPLDEVKAILAGKDSILKQVEIATKCDHCDWGLRFPDLRGSEVVDFSLVEFQSVRELARILRLKSKLEIAEKRFDEAILTLRHLYQLSRNVGQCPNLISNLVATAIQSISNDSVIELISADGSPSLYWALRGLPVPLVDFQPAIELESTMALRLFPFLRDADTAQRSADAWHQLLANVITTFDERQPRPDPNQLSNQLLITGIFMKAYPIAKRDLIASGFDAAKLEKMPTGQVIAIHARECYVHYGDEYRKWMTVPFAEGNEHLRQATERLTSEGYLSATPNIPSDHDPLLINTRLGYSAVQIRAAQNRQAFMSASLIAIEAIRIHASNNGGKLPSSLDQITIVPVPNDPSTNRPFLYRIADGNAELLVPPADGNAASGRRFSLQVK